MSRYCVYSTASRSYKCKIFRDTEWEEFVVRFYKDGILLTKLDYFTDTIEDAKATAKSELNLMELKNGKISK